MYVSFVCIIYMYALICSTLLIFALWYPPNLLTTVSGKLQVYFNFSTRNFFCICNYTFLFHTAFATG